MSTTKTFDSETGALSREFVNFNKELDSSRKYGKTKELDDHPLLKPQISVISGPTGSGKTMVALNLLQEIHETVNPKRLGRIMFYTGSISDPLIQKLDPKAVSVYGPEQAQSFLDELRSIRLETRHVAEDQLPLNVLILDDTGASKLLSPSQVKGSEIGEILVSHRHIGIHVMLLAQRIKGMLSPFVLANMSQLFMFPGKNKSDEDELLRNIPIPREQIQKMLQAIATEDHQFLWVNVAKKTAYRGFSDPILT
jgi:hypothetical protein